MYKQPKWPFLYVYILQLRAPFTIDHSTAKWVEFMHILYFYHHYLFLLFYLGYVMYVVELTRFLSCSTRIPHVTTSLSDCPIVAAPTLFSFCARRMASCYKYIIYIYSDIYIILMLWFITVLTFILQSIAFGNIYIGGHFSWLLWERKATKDLRSQAWWWR